MRPWIWIVPLSRAQTLDTKYFCNRKGKQRGNSQWDTLCVGKVLKVDAVFCSCFEFRKGRVDGCSDLVREEPHEVAVTVEMAWGTTARIITTQESTEQPRAARHHTCLPSALLQHYTSDVTTELNFRPSRQGGRGKTKWKHTVQC